MIKQIKHFWFSFRDFLTWDQWSDRSWSQEGEDMVLRRIFGQTRNGFYVDVGAHHPKRFSNTHRLYLRGWRGINIDAMPGSMRLFKRHRPRDINLEIGISRERKVMQYFIFNEPALNGFSSEVANARVKTGGRYKIDNVVNIATYPLGEILECNLNSGQKIDLLTIDVEGLDFEVLQSNDWFKFRPNYILVEILDFKYDKDIGDPLVEYMKLNGYMVFSKLVNSVLFKDNLQVARQYE